MKYEATIHAKKTIMRQKLVSLTRQLAKLKSKTEAYILSLRLSIDKSIREPKMGSIDEEYVSVDKSDDILCTNLHNLSLTNKKYVATMINI